MRVEFFGIFIRPSLLNWGAETNDHKIRADTVNFGNDLLVLPSLLFKIAVPHARDRKGRIGRLQFFPGLLGHPGFGPEEKKPKAVLGTKICEVPNPARQSHFGRRHRTKNSQPPPNALAIAEDNGPPFENFLKPGMFSNERGVVNIEMKENGFSIFPDSRLDKRKQVLGGNKIDRQSHQIKSFAPRAGPFRKGHVSPLVLFPLVGHGKLNYTDPCRYQPRNSRKRHFMPTIKILKGCDRIFAFLFSLFWVTFLLFSLCEFFPSLPRLLKLDGLPYYALNERYVPDKDLIFRIQPGSRFSGTFVGDHHGFFSSGAAERLPYRAEFDDEGFRNVGKPDHAEIVVLGDSYIQFGLEEKDTFAARLERATGAVTANYGMEWYGPPQYLSVFKKDALRRKPRIALFCFFEGNDLRDIREYLRWKKGGSYYHFHARSRKFFARYFLMMRSTLFFTAKMILRNWDPRQVEVRLTGSRFETIFVYPMDSRSPEELIHSPEGEALKNILAEFKAMSAAKGITPVLVFIPSSTHIFLPHATPWIYRAINRNFEKQMRSRPHVETMVGTLARELGIPGIDLTPSFEEATKAGRVLYYVSDTHWNSEGRELAAKIVASALSSGESVWTALPSKKIPPTTKKYP